MSLNSSNHKSKKNILMNSQNDFVYFKNVVVYGVPQPHKALWLPPYPSPPHSSPLNLFKRLFKVFGTKVEKTEADPCKLCKEIRLYPKENGKPMQIRKSPSKMTALTAEVPVLALGPPWTLYLFLKPLHQISISLSLKSKYYLNLAYLLTHFLCHSRSFSKINLLVHPWKYRYCTVSLLSLATFCFILCSLILEHTSSVLLHGSGNNY